MTPTVGPRATSFFPQSIADQSAVVQQRYLIARILEGDRRLLSDPARGNFSIAQRLRQIPAEDRRAIEEAGGPSTYEFSALAEERTPALFYEGVLRAARRSEDEDHFEVAQRCYFFLSELNQHGGSVPEHIQRRARERLAILGGGGTFSDRMEFAVSRLPRQTLDPTFFIGMGAASVAARAFRWRLLISASNGIGVTPRLVPQLFRAGVTATVESVAFVAAERGSAVALGRPTSPVTAPEEWLRYGLPMFMGTRLAGSLAGQTYRNGLLGRRTWLPNGSLEGASWRHRLGHTAWTQAAILGATFLAQDLESTEAKSARIPRDAFAQSLLWSLTFATFTSATRRASGRRLIALERGLFRR
jgi:hypothetical protein